MTGPFISSDTIVSSLLFSVAASLAAAAAIPSARQLANLCKRLTPMQVVVLLTAVSIATASAQKSGTNIVEGASNTNDVAIVLNTNGVDVVEGTNSVDDVGGSNVTDNADGEVPPPLMTMLGAPNPILPPDDSNILVSPADLARGYRLDSVSTNDAISYEMPDDATEVGTWRLTGAYDDVEMADLGEFRFPLGTNLCSSLWAQTWGTARPRLRNVSNELVAVGAPMSAIPGVSRFWTAQTANDSFLLTWQDFALGRIPASTNTSCLLPLTSYLFSAQIELKRNGDFFARSNNVESVYRRINPDDWDDDGWSNDEDSSPYEADEDGFGPHQDLSFIVYSNNYYWVDLVVSNANALVTFESELPSVLPNPQFIARAGATNRVVLLLGKPYEVKCAQPVVCVETSHSDVEVMERYEGCLVICRPVICEFVSLPLLMATPQGCGLLGLGGGGMTLSLSPEPEGYEVSLGACCCMTQVGGGLPYFYCMGNCGCGGCSSGDISVTYDGTALTFPGYSCPCSHDPDPGPDTPQDDPSGPSVSASFSHEAIIFEDAYENEPGVTIPRRSTDVEVEFCVYGGTNGGTYAFSIVGSNKLARVNGDALREGTVAVGQVITVKARYEGRAASGSEGDIIAKAEFTENGSGLYLSDEHSQLTAVKVEIEPVVGREGCPHRHRMGVREEFLLNTYPDCVSKFVSCPQDFLAMKKEPGKYKCPIRASSGVLGIVVSQVDFHVSLSVVEPTGVLCTSGFDKCEDGCIAMELEPYITPMDVCFSNIRIMEVPTSANGPSGYFTNAVFSSIWYHTLSRGAGNWRRIGRDNFFFADTPSFAEYCPPPLAFGTIDWVIPLAWAEDDASSLNDTMGAIETVYHQVFTINAAGDLQIDKFSQWIRCSADGHVTHSQGIR